MAGLNLKSTGGGGVAITPALTSVDITVTTPSVSGTLATKEALAAGSGAGLVGFTPASGIAATTVQGAIAEVGADLTAIQNGAVFIIGNVVGTNTITGNLTPAITSYVVGQTFRFVSVGANTSAVTININGMGAKAVTKSGSVPLVSGDIPSGAAVTLIYDGVRFQLSSGSGSSSVSNGSVNLLTQSSGINVIAGTGQVFVGPLTIPTGQQITVASGSRLVIL